MKNENPIHYHITSIFTSKLLLFFAFIFFVLSLLTHRPEMTVMMLFIIVLNVVSYAWSRFLFKQLFITISHDKTHLFPGDDITINIHIRNRKLLPVWITATPVFDTRCFEHKTNHTKTICLLWFQKTALSYKLTAKKRGVYTIDYPSIKASDLFGFFPRQKVLSSPIEVIVFPRLCFIQPFDIPEQHFFSLPGLKSPVQDPVYILGTREYQNATPAKMIHWKASARFNRLREKVCEPSVQGRTLIIVDVSQFSDDRNTDRFERLLETAAAIAVFYEKKGHNIGFFTNAELIGSEQYVIPCDTGNEATTRILCLISRIQIRAKRDIKGLFYDHAASFRGISVVLCCHDASSLSVQHLKKLCRRKKIQLKIIQTKTDKGEDTALRSLSDKVINMDSICL